MSSKVIRTCLADSSSGAQDSDPTDHIAMRHCLVHCRRAPDSKATNANMSRPNHSMTQESQTHPNNATNGRLTRDLSSPTVLTGLEEGWKPCWFTVGRARRRVILSRACGTPQRPCEIVRPLRTVACSGGKEWGLLRLNMSRML